MNNDDSFKNKKLSSKIIIIAVIFIMLLLTIGFVIATFFFGITGLFSLLGVEYRSPLSLLWFSIFYFLVSILGDIVIKALVIITDQSKRIPKYFKKYSLLIYAFLINWCSISLLNELMDTVHIHFYSQVVLSAILAFLEYIFYDDKSRIKEKPFDSTT